MGTISMQSNALVATIQDDGTVDSGCIGTKTITVIVPAGTTKHVQFTVSSVDAYVVPSPAGLEEVISVNKQYAMEIDGDDTTTPIGDQITCTVRQYAGGPLDAFDQYSRAHSANKC